MDYLIGIDLGTSQLVALAWEVEGDRLLAVERMRNTYALAAAEQDVEALLAAALQLLARLSRRPELAQARPLALGITGQMHGLALVDHTGRPLSSLITWQDERGEQRHRASGRTLVEEFRARLGSQALEDSGCLPATGYGGVTLLRLGSEGAWPSKAVALSASALLVQRLCARAVMDPSDAAGWGLFDVRHGARWLPGIISALDLPANILPEVIPSGGQAGTLLPELARAVGLPANLPVAVALGDNQAAFLGSTSRLADTLLMNLGTGGQMSLPAPRFLRLPELETRPLIEGLWLLTGASLCGGRAYEVLKAFYERIGRELFSISTPPPLYEIMNGLAAQAPPDCKGLRARTLFAGTRSDPQARGSWEGLTALNLTPANLTRAVIRGMVEELSDFYQRAVDAGIQASWLVGAGNAVRHNALLRQELQSRLGLAVHLSPSAEEAALGAALAGGITVRVYADWHAAARRRSAS